MWYEETLFSWDCKDCIHLNTCNRWGESGGCSKWTDIHQSNNKFGLFEDSDKENKE